MFCLAADSSCVTLRPENHHGWSHWALGSAFTHRHTHTHTHTEMHMYVNAALPKVQLGLTHVCRKKVTNTVFDPSILFLCDFTRPGVCWYTSVAQKQRKMCFQACVLNMNANSNGQTQPLRYFTHTPPLARL